MMAAARFQWRPATKTKKDLKMNRIAVIMTCYNRHKTTLSCLESVMSQDAYDASRIRIYLVDDASKDNTGGEVTRRFPQVRVIQGTGNLYWCGGMRTAWAEASEWDPDGYLWLNDDTILLTGALGLVLGGFEAASRRFGRKIIIVGSTKDPVDGKWTYGGYRAAEPVMPGGGLEEIDTFNGNLVLVSRETFQSLGNLSDRFQHSFGDIEYGIRARRTGIKMLLVGSFLGCCSANIQDAWCNPRERLIRRWQIFHSPKGLRPSELAYFARQSVGCLWPLVVLKAYMKMLFPALFRK
jgi:GT2 family glycosyltransferase